MPLTVQELLSMARVTPPTSATAGGSMLLEGLHGAGQGNGGLKGVLGAFGMMEQSGQERRKLDISQQHADAYANYAEGYKGKAGAANNPLKWRDTFADNAAKLDDIAAGYYAKAVEIGETNTTLADDFYAKAEDFAQQAIDMRAMGAGGTRVAPGVSDPNLSVETRPLPLPKEEVPWDGADGLVRNGQLPSMGKGVPDPFQAAPDDDIATPGNTLTEEQLDAQAAQEAESQAAADAESEQVMQGIPGASLVKNGQLPQVGRFTALEQKRNVAIEKALALREAGDRVGAALALREGNVPAKTVLEIFGQDFALEKNIDVRERGQDKAAEAQIRSSGQKYDPQFTTYEGSKVANDAESEFNHMYANLQIKDKLEGYNSLSKAEMFLQGNPLQQVAAVRMIAMAYNKGALSEADYRAFTGNSWVADVLGRVNANLGLGKSEDEAWQIAGAGFGGLPKELRSQATQLIQGGLAEGHRLIADDANKFLGRARQYEAQADDFMARGQMNDYETTSRKARAFREKSSLYFGEFMPRLRSTDPAANNPRETGSRLPSVAPDSPQQKHRRKRLEQPVEVAAPQKVTDGIPEEGRPLEEQPIPLDAADE